ncbi:hypothetical protein DNTS_035047 [Danionella cerebrum]|uniref:Uncharacterized protein n=1 Tax=Danionella cerebrum TaxID=2873325 RepID=A0A553MRM2_9TELE|nr:hypothetical protein DNTS_035047 [Danionella translucida]
MANQKPCLSRVPEALLSRFLSDSLSRIHAVPRPAFGSNPSHNITIIYRGITRAKARIWEFSTFVGLKDGTPDQKGRLESNTLRIQKKKRDRLVNTDAPLDTPLHSGRLILALGPPAHRQSCCYSYALGSRAARCGSLSGVTADQNPAVMASALTACRKHPS